MLRKKMQEKIRWLCLHTYFHRIKFEVWRSVPQLENEGMIAPNFHLRVSLAIIYFLGTWPPIIGKFRLLYLLYTACSFTFILGILLAAEIASVLANWGDMTKLIAVATLLMTNCTHASKVIVIIFVCDSNSILQ